MSLQKKVLVLHGWTQNGAIFRARLGPFCRECEGRGIDLVFLDAPHPVDPDEIISNLAGNPAFAQDEQLRSAEFKEELRKSNPRAWWSYNQERTRAPGLEETLEVLRKALGEQTFDGVFGFSQGAALAVLIAAILERPHTYPSFVNDGKPLHPPLQFCIAVSGFRLTDPVTEKIYESPYKTPTLHILGEKDKIVSISRSQPLLDLGESKKKRCS